ncbi:MAG: L-seryl-tRNA(Sec) selenium transferase [Dehalococcoidia bacterium]
MRQRLPSVDLVLRQVPDMAEMHGHIPLTALVRGLLAGYRAARDVPSLDEVLADLRLQAEVHFRPSLRGVVNATGVVIHTNLGRAPLSAEAIVAMSEVSRAYSNLEFDLDSGRRGSRFTHVERLLCEVTGAEAAIAVNNNASALLLVLSALCRDREVVISRGQLVEIGGGFRIPDVMAQSGARMVEAGTTNRTYLADYENAVGEETAALIRVHSSNFKVIGFTNTVALTEMANLARRRRLLLIDDLGSGCLLDTREFGLAEEPRVQQSLADGDLVLFSGDKLLGGPQAGLIVGRKRLIEKLRKHPLSRALRMDKASIAALNVTLRHYARGEALAKVPVWRMIAARPEDLRRRASRWRRAIGRASQVIAGRSMIGGGSLPEESLPTFLLAIPEAEGVKPAELAARLRNAERPVIGRLADGKLLLDPRTVDVADDSYVAAVVKALLPG